MNAEKKRVLIVDDSTDDIQFIMENIKDEYAVLVATNGVKGLDVSSNNPRPDVILMDVMMPEMTGYEACRKIKENPDTQDISVIFISANYSTEEILAGYDAGGSDYLTKPVNPDELLKKIKLTIDDDEKKIKLRKENLEINKAFMTSMTANGELGGVLSFLRESFFIDDYDKLGKQIVKTLFEEMSLNSTVQIRIFDEVINYSPDGNIFNLEAELLKRVRDGGRIINYGKRLILNFGDISVLVKNMPLEDADLCGRIRDNLSLMLEGAMARLSSITVLIENRNYSVHAMREVLQQLESNFLALDLTEEQEKLIINIVKDGTKKAIGEI